MGVGLIDWSVVKFLSKHIRKLNLCVQKVEASMS